VLARTRSARGTQRMDSRAWRTRQLPEGGSAHARVRAPPARARSLPPKGPRGPSPPGRQRHTIGGELVDWVERPSPTKDQAAWENFCGMLEGTPRHIIADMDGKGASNGRSTRCRRRALDGRFVSRDAELVRHVRAAHPPADHRPPPSTGTLHPSGGGRQRVAEAEAPLSAQRISATASALEFGEHGHGARLTPRRKTGTPGAQRRTRRVLSRGPCPPP